MRISKANKDQFEAVRSFYHSLIDAMKDSPYDIGWKKDIYPARSSLRNR